MVADFIPTLRRAIQLAREAGLTEPAAELEGQCFAAYTTSSEFLGETGEAILRFTSRKDVPPEVAALLDECLREIGKVIPLYRPGLLGKLRRWLTKIG